jgi:hypothetical protein
VNVRGSLTESSEEQEETRGEQDGLLRRVLGHRRSHRERSMFVRVGVVVGGGTLSVFAGLFSVIAPEFGLPLLLLGLKLLALEFDWAARAYARVARLARRVGERLRNLLPRSKRGAILMLVVVAAVEVQLITMGPW